MTVRKPESFSAAARATLSGGQIIAGGTALQPALNLSGRGDVTLVSLSGIADAWVLSEADPRRLRIGAMVPVSRLDRWGLAPRWFATPAVRRRATLVGNLVHANGLRELLPLVSACAGFLRWCGPDGVVSHAPTAGSVATSVELTIPDILIHQRTAVRSTMARPICTVTLAEVAGAIRVVTTGTGSPPSVIEDVDSDSTPDEFVDAVLTGSESSDPERLAVLARRTHDHYRRWQCAPRR